MSWRSARERPSRLPAGAGAGAAGARQGRPRQHLAGGGGCGRQDPKPSSPRGCSAREARRVAGQALAHRSGRPTLSSVQGLRAGAGRGEEGGEQRPRQGGVHPAGARGARGTLLGGAPFAGRGAPRWAPRFLRSAGLVAGCWQPSGVWLDVPAEPGGPSGAGLRQLEKGYPLGLGLGRGRGGAGPLTRARSPVGGAGGSASARGPGRAEVPSCVAVQSMRDSLGGTGVPACGVRDYAGDLGCARSQGCAALQGRAVGQVRRRARRGAGV